MRSGAFKNIGATFVEPFPYKENRKTFLRNLTISPTGTGNGVSAPASLSGIASLLQPGDRVWMHPGVYNFTAQIDYTISGNALDMILFQPMNEGTAIIDGSGVTPGVDYQMKISGNFMEWNGVEVRNMPQKGFMIVGNDNIFRNVWVHHCNGSGIHIMNPVDNNVQTAQSRNLITDCLAHHCSDANLASLGENADGYSVSIGDYNILRRCIAHTNSDDGYDVWQSDYTLVDSCVSFNNGYGTNGDGNGFKLGNINSTGNGIINSIAYGNLSRGFDSNGSTDSWFKNCTAFNQKIAFNMTATNPVTDCIGDTPSQTILGVLTNNSWLSTEIPTFISQVYGEDGFAEPTNEFSHKLLTYRFNDATGAASNPSNKFLRFNTASNPTNIYITNKNVWMEDTLATVNTFTTGNKILFTNNTGSYLVFTLSSPAAGVGYSTLVGTVFRSKGKFVQDDIINVSIF